MRIRLRCRMDLDCGEPQNLDLLEERLREEALSGVPGLRPSIGRGLNTLNE